MVLLKEVLLAILGALLLVGLAISDDSQFIPLTSVSKGTLFNYEDNTFGVGGFANYNKIVKQGPHSDARTLERLADISLLKKGHGSGSLEREMIIHSGNTINQNSSPDYNYKYSMVNAFASSNVIYSPQTIIVGTGYYAAHPVDFNSLLGDTTQIKNHASGTSMYHETTYARAIKEDLVTKVEDDYYDVEWLPSASLARTLMSLNESVTDGTAQIAMLQGRRVFEYGKSALYKPDIDVEQTYTGSFGIATTMNLTITKSKSLSTGYWLPCLSGGWDGMKYYDQKGFGASTKGIFDCTCPKVRTRAQYPLEV
jgi:hypothetical protein